MPFGQNVIEHTKALHPKRTKQTTHYERCKLKRFLTKIGCCVTEVDEIPHYHKLYFLVYSQPYVLR